MKAYECRYEGGGEIFSNFYWAQTATWRQAWENTLASILQISKWRRAKCHSMMLKTLL